MEKNSPNGQPDSQKEKTKMARSATKRASDEAAATTTPQAANAPKGEFAAMLEESFGKSGSLE